MNRNNEVELSVVIPVYKAESSIRYLIESLTLSLNNKPINYEIICVDDNSPDNSLRIIREMMDIYPTLRVYTLSKNFGQLEATTCGINLSKGKVIVTMDDDMQFDPNELIGLYDFFYANDYLLVFGVPIKYNSPAFLKVKRSLAMTLFKHIIMPKYKKVIFFSSLRIFHASLWNSYLKNLYYVWKIPPDKIGNYKINHQQSLKPHSSYTLWKRIKHFVPYMLFAYKKIFFVLFLICFLLNALLTLGRFSHHTLNLLCLFLFFLYLLFMSLLLIRERVSYFLKPN